MLGLVTVRLASIDFVRRPDPRFPRWLSVVGAVTVAAFAIFLAILFGGDNDLAHPEERVAVWSLTIFEWLLDRRHPAVGLPDRVDVAGRHRRTDRAGTSARTQQVDLSVDLGRGLVLANPILVASGTFGYGIEYGDVVDVDRLGAICCKGTTLRPRIGNPTPRVTETPGGMLNSIGLQNPGVDAVIEKYAATWTGWKVPMIVNVAGESVEDYVEVARRLDGVPGVAGIELNISCPNVGKGGLQFAIDAGAAGEVTAAVRRATDLPLLVKLSPNVADIRPIARAIADAGADALTAINTLSGIAVAPGRTKPLLGNIYGGLSGPAVKPVALRIVYEAAQVVKIPVVAIGGVTELADVLDFLAVGAVAVQVGTAIFADPTLPVRLVDELADECRAAGTGLVPRPDRDRAAGAARHPVVEGRRVPAVETSARDHHPTRHRRGRPRRDRRPDRGAVPRVRRVPRGPLPAQERPPRRRLRREVRGPVRSGGDERAVRVLGRARPRPRRRTDGRPGRRPDDRRRHPRLRDRPPARVSAASSPRRSATTTGRPAASSGAGSASSPASASSSSTTS